MSNKNKNFAPILENVKSCLIELGLSVDDKINEKDTIKFIIGIKDNDMGIFMEISCKADIVNIKVSPNFAFEVLEVVPFYQLLNEMNLRLMDIGHFSVNEADQAVLLQTSVDLSDENFNREQMLTTIQRISLQGLELFKLLQEMFNGDQCPFHLLYSYIEEIRENRVNNEKTIH
jgi:hypothetical protein